MKSSGERNPYAAHSRSDPNGDVRARIIVDGLVQGVFFRREVTDLARRLGLTGWVRNLKDGRVEAVAEGDKHRVDQLIRFCHSGPPAARVRHVEVEWLDPTGEFHGFRITK
jgi:acylphosphatase